MNEDDWNGESATTFCTIHSASLTPRTGFGSNPTHYKDSTAYSKAITRFLIANKFVAHLLRAGTGRYKIFMIWTMRSALEYSPAQRSGMEDPEVYVPAAAACILIAGEKLRSFEDEWVPGELTGRPALGGPLWEGKQGFCEGRWRLWRVMAVLVSSCGALLGLSIAMLVPESWAAGGELPALLLSTPSDTSRKP